MQVLTAFDLDTDRLADTLRDLADGIDDGTVAVTAASEDTSARVNNDVESTLTIEYLAEDPGLIHPLQFEKWGGDE